MNEVEKFLKRFHSSNDIDTVFTCGCCYWFAYILHTRFQDSVIMYDEVMNHFVVKINDRLYDVTGDVTDIYKTSVIPWDELKDDLLRERIIRDCINF